MAKNTDPRRLWSPEKRKAAGLTEVGPVKPNFEEDTNQAAKPADLAAVVALAEEMLAIERWMTRAAEQVAEKQERYKQIEQTLLPDMMTQIGVSSLDLKDGNKVKIDDIVRASIPSQTSIEKAKDAIERSALEARRAAAFAWLKKNKAEALIKTEVVAEFGKGQTKAAAQIVKEITKKGYPASLSEVVHPGTLSKFIKESIASGVSVPEDTFALFTGKMAKIEAPKPKKVGK